MANVLVGCTIHHTPRSLLLSKLYRNASPCWRKISFNVNVTNWSSSSFSSSNWITVLFLAFGLKFRGDPRGGLRGLQPPLPPWEVSELVWLLVSIASVSSQNYSILLLYICTPLLLWKSPGSAPVVLNPFDQSLTRRRVRAQRRCPYCLSRSSCRSAWRDQRMPALWLLLQLFEGLISLNLTPG